MIPSHTKRTYGCFWDHTYQHFQMDYDHFTLQKKEVWAQLFVPAKCFKIWHIIETEFYLINALVYVNIDQGIHKVKTQKCSKWKTKKLCGFSFSINMANCEAFRRNKKLSSNLFFLKSEFKLKTKLKLVFIFLVSQINWSFNFDGKTKYFLNTFLPLGLKNS